jgi:hypothetical protein
VAATCLATCVSDLFLAYLLSVGGLGAIGLTNAFTVWSVGAMLIS